jgi:hypothetical protein
MGDSKIKAITEDRAEKRKELRAVTSKLVTLKLKPHYQLA